MPRGQPRAHSCPEGNAFSPSCGSRSAESSRSLWACSAHPRGPTGPVCPRRAVQRGRIASNSGPIVRGQGRFPREACEPARRSLWPDDVHRWGHRRIAASRSLSSCDTTRQWRARISASRSGSNSSERTHRSSVCSDSITRSAAAGNSAAISERDLQHAVLVGVQQVAGRDDAGRRSRPARRPSRLGRTRAIPTGPAAKK